MPKEAKAVLNAPMLLQEGPEWLVLVPAYGGAVQTYHCDSERRARALLRVFERVNTPAPQAASRR